MNAFIHKHKKTIFWIILSGFLFATFAVFGGGGYFTHRADMVAKVNSKIITYTEYQKNARRAISNQREQAEDKNLSEEDIKNIKLSVLQNLISEEAFIQVAQTYGLKVTDKEVMLYLQQIPAFQKEGHFDHQTYFNTLRYGIKMTAAEFEEDRRRTLLAERVKSFIYFLGKVPETEAVWEYRRRNGSMQNWGTEKEEFLQTLQNEKINYFFNQWITEIQQTTEIKEFLQKFESL